MQFWDLKMSKMALADCSGVGDAVIAKLQVNLLRWPAFIELSRWNVSLGLTVPPARPAKPIHMAKPVTQRMLP
jgi:hypothetical protein